MLLGIRLRRRAHHQLPLPFIAIDWSIGRNPSTNLISNRVSFSRSETKKQFSLYLSIGASSSFVHRDRPRGRKGATDTHRVRSNTRAAAAAAHDTETAQIGSTGREEYVFRSDLRVRQIASRRPAACVRSLSASEYNFRILDMLNDKKKGWYQWCAQFNSSLIQLP